jgi:FK506-binding protein 4/5
MTASQDITPELDGGVIKTVKVPGPDPNDKPWKGDRVWVHYTGTLEDGTKFDSSVDRGEKFQFSLGKADVIKGWDLGVATMAKGEISLFKIRADYAYGAMGKPPTIPENATLLFEIELCKYKQRGDIVTRKILKIYVVCTILSIRSASKSRARF